jgi:hypothetical protein
VESLNRRTLRCLSQALLVYLLGLHLVGTPLHSHADSVPNEDGAAVVVANDACLLCDWLVQPSLVLAESCFVEALLPLPALRNAAIPTQWISAWEGFPSGSRAPPLVYSPS